MRRNPFLTANDAEYVDAQSRIEMVKTFSANECRASLELSDLQKTVRLAVERRLRRLAKEAA